MGRVDALMGARGPKPGTSATSARHQSNHRGSQASKTSQVKAYQSMHLYMHERLTYEQIGDRVGWTKSAVCKGIAAVMDEYRQEAMIDAEAMITVEMMRLNGLWASTMQVLADAGEPELALKAVSAGVKVSESIRKLWGLDAAQKHEVTGVDGGPIEVEAARGAVAKLHAMLRSVDAESSDLPMGLPELPALPSVGDVG